MVLVEAYFVYIDRVALLEPPQCLEHELLDTFVQQGLSILYGDLDVVVAFGNVVVPVPNTLFRFDVRTCHAYALYCMLGHSSLRRAQGVLAVIFKTSSS